MDSRRNSESADREIRARIAGLKRRRRFVSRREARQLADELDELLYDIESCNSEPCRGAELIAGFYETDVAVFGNCDDSSGYVGDVYRLHACELFLKFAAGCEDKEWLGDLILELNQRDDYGVRDSITDCAGGFLPDAAMRRLIGQFQAMADSASDQYGKRRWLMLVESLARQLGDAPLFEKTRLASWDRISTAACVDIAEVYLEAGDAKTALSWLDRVSTDETFLEDKRDALLLRIHDRLGDSYGQVDAARKLFRRSPSTEALEQLVGVLGEDRRDAVVEDEVHVVLSEQELSYEAALFLTEIERYDTTEGYLIQRADQLNGDYYDWLLPIADAMVTAGYPLAASLVYRALIESILQKARSKIYHYAVRYLKKLDVLAKQVQDWGESVDHASYLEQLRMKHGRKTSFWSRYERSR